MVLDKILEFLKHLHRGYETMSADISSVLDKVTAQGQLIAAQGDQIKQLVAARDAREQADLQKISDALDTNGFSIKANTAQVAAALAPASIVGQAKTSEPTAAISAVVTAPTSAGDTTIPVSTVSVGQISTAADAAAAAGATVAVSGPAIADGTTIAGVDTAASTITLSQPTEAAHVGDGTETLTVAQPAS